MASAEFIRRFGVPQVAEGVIDEMIPPMEQDFLVQLPEGGWFSPQRARPWLTKAAGRDIDTDEAGALLRLAYERGVLEMQQLSFGEDYRLSDFFTFLDVFSVAEPERWTAMDKGLRRTLDEAYLARYLAGLGQSTPDGLPTEDEVLPLAEVVERVLADERPVYLSACDCRALHTGDGAPGGAQYCLSYRTAPGSYASRGLGKAITRRQAADVVRAADAAGLIHTVNPGGICNCGPEWCYLFRGGEKLGMRGRWPRVSYRASLDSEACIGCGACVRRCPFQLFSLGEDGALCADFEGCVGCGLCVSACPSGALALLGR